ncbi:YoaK family protein [Microbacterium sp. TPD7012]|uniref:YoaK family protein n=1 Tax=unclassified Microbacterium TaxID=2609290 RepID=UPI001402A510|nr:YoaK family protein [Microbacterium sp. TPD7012]
MATPVIAPRSGERAPTVTLWMMMVLTFVTGLVDAVGFLGLDRVFVGNMTGNIVILGMAVAGADDLPVLGPAIALGTFTVGAYIGGMVLRRRRREWSGGVSLLLLTGAFVLALLGVAYLIPDWAASDVLELIASSTTAAAMGMQAAVARSLAVADVTTVVVTSTLTSLASESLVDGGVKGVWNRRFAAIAIIFVGALVGALLLRFGVAVPLLLAGALTVAVVAFGHRSLHTRAVAV